MKPFKVKLSIDDINDLKYAIVNQLVKDGVLKDCTDTDEQDEVIAENAVFIVLYNRLSNMGIDIEKE